MIDANRRLVAVRAHPCARACLAAALLSAGLSPSSARAAPAVETAAEGVRFERGLKRARDAARRLDRPLLVSFWATWCPWCRKLDQSTYRDPQVAALARDFVAVKVDVEGGLDESRFAAELGVESVPTIVFLSPAGRRLAQRARFEDAATFAATLTSVQALAATVRPWEQALARDAREPAALAALGAWLLEQDNAGEARPLLQRALQVDRARPAAERKRTRVALGGLLAHERRTAAAERLLREALALEPADAAQDAAALVGLGDLQRASGEASAARGSWEAALRLVSQGPSAARAREGLASLPAR